MNLYIFTDASSNKRFAVGAYAFTTNLNEELNKEHIFPVTSDFNLKDVTTSTIGELETIKLVLSMIPDRYPNYLNLNINLYTDCENFINIYKERQYKPNFSSHRNYVLYKTLIDLLNQYKVNINWTKGHNKKETILTLAQEKFKIIDIYARQMLRSYSESYHNII
jgi:ribonuclease HI